MELRFIWSLCALGWERQKMPGNIGIPRPLFRKMLYREGQADALCTELDYLVEHSTELAKKRINRLERATSSSQ